VGPDGDFEDTAPDFGAGDFGVFGSAFELPDSDLVAAPSDFVAEDDSDDGLEGEPEEVFEFSARLSLR
jgi:hypothetical protein